VRIRTSTPVHCVVGFDPMCGLSRIFDLISIGAELLIGGGDPRRRRSSAEATIGGGDHRRRRPSAEATIGNSNILPFCQIVS
jgi:hypothetical protein